MFELRAQRNGRVVLTAVGLALTGCGGDALPDLPPEPWAGRPIAEWPDLALTNDIRLADTTYEGLANAFLVDTGADTVGVTVKHIFMIFRHDLGLEDIFLGEQWRDWSFRSSRGLGPAVDATRLLNEDPREAIPDFEGVEDRDWLVFSLGSIPEGLYPLKVRYAPIGRGEVVYAVGRSRARRADRVPSRVRLKRYQDMGLYYYMTVLDGAHDPVETSGSAVIDSHGYLVGIVTGAVGELSVVCSVAALRRVFDRFGVPYTTPE